MKYKWWFFGLLLFLISLFFDKTIIDYATENRIIEFNEVAILFTTYTSWVFSFLLVGFIILIWKRKHIYRYLISSGIFFGLIWLIKTAIQRPRPFLEISLIPTETGYSFPSGHASFAFFSLIFIWKLFPKFKWIWLIIVILISLTRVYAGVHYLSDVIGGMLIGLFFSLLSLKQKLFKFKK